jgi:RNA polymerase sigma-70 factor (ECF subfamily)
MRVYEDNAESDTDRLVERAAQGDAVARDDLLNLHRDRLKRMVAVRLDPRMAGRIDPSDVVQETLAAAEQRLDRYLAEQPVAWYPWLRSLAWNQLIDIHRRHVRAQRRSVAREEPWEKAMSDASATRLAECLPGKTLSPSRQILQQEIQKRVRSLLAELPCRDREIIVMRHLEGMSVREIASILEIPEGTVKSRHFRILESLRRVLSED